MKKENVMTKVVYNPEFDKLLLVEIKSGKEKQRVHFLMDKTPVIQDLDTMATLNLIDESVVLGDL